MSREEAAAKFVEIMGEELVSRDAIVATFYRRLRHGDDMTLEQALGGCAKELAAINEHHAKELIRLSMTWPKYYITEAIPTNEETGDER